MKTHKASKLDWETDPVSAALEEWAFVYAQYEMAKERLQAANEEMRAASTHFQLMNSLLAQKQASLIDARVAINK